MANISAQLVKELRQQSGAGMMECKKALQKTEGDLERAMQHLRESGAAKAAKRASRTAAEGSVFIKANGNKAAILEVNCETDFVAKSDDFQNFANEIIEKILATGDASVADTRTDLFANQSLEQAKLAIIAKLGENITIRRAQLFEAKVGEFLGVYLHGGTFAKIGTVICLKGGSVELAKDIAMQAAAMHPEYLDKTAVPADRVAKEKAIFAELVKKTIIDKPAATLEKIITGKLEKRLNEISLLGQQFIKDNGTTIAKLLEKNNATITSYVRFEVGEGIEKKQDDFVAEVMSQARKS